MIRIEATVNAAFEGFGPEGESLGATGLERPQRVSAMTSAA